jgi:hypothetical protein
MRSYQVFAAMPPERALAMLRALSEKSPQVFRQTVDTAALATRTRPVYLRRQSFEKRSEAVRRALSRVAANPLADELLAVYFLECRKPLLTEWLDLVGVTHEEGTLEEAAPAQPAQARLQEAVEAFRSKQDDPDRALLLSAFAAQEAIDWPALDALLAHGGTQP